MLAWLILIVIIGFCALLSYGLVYVIARTPWLGVLLLLSPFLIGLIYFGHAVISESLKVKS
jgi:hypothetical protein